MSNLLFSGSAADMLKSMGKAVPEAQPMTGLAESQAAKKMMDAEKVCTDEDCTEDHTHGHSHGHGETCTEDHSHGHGHAEKAGGHDHGHGHDGEHPVATRLRSALAATHVEVIAEGAGCGQKLQIVVVSAQFEGKPLLKQHRMINEAAKDELAKVHAFNVKSYTPAKWAARS